MQDSNRLKTESRTILRERFATEEGLESEFRISFTEFPASRSPFIPVWPRSSID
jgi:hypothetical protein